MKNTYIQFKLSRDIDLLHAYDYNIRGGVPTVIKHHNEANYKYMNSNFSNDIHWFNSQYEHGIVVNFISDISQITELLKNKTNIDKPLYMGETILIQVK